MEWGRGVRGIEDGETHVHPLLIHVHIWQKQPQCCKVIILQLKFLIFFKKRMSNVLFTEDKNLVNYNYGKRAQIPFLFL